MRIRISPQAYYFMVNTEDNLINKYYDYYVFRHILLYPSLFMFYVEKKGIGSIGGATVLHTEG
jgi:hypothetical protein